MMKRFVLGMCGAYVLSSCIRSELPPCPPMQIDISVKDKNYFNVAEASGFEPEKVENLPFRDYVSTLYYIITEAGSGKVIQEKTTFEVTGEQKDYRIVMPEDLPYGKYVITAWGNLKSEHPLGDDAAYGDMMSEEARSRDIYVTTDTLDYRVGHEAFRTDLERTKGKLLIRVEQVPDYVNHSAKSISNVYQYVGRKLNYAIPETVVTDTVWKEPNTILTGTLLCPSVAQNESKLQIRFDEKDGEKALTPEDIQITMSRNALTVVRYVYQKESGDFDIYVLVDDNWEKVHGMEIE